MEIIVHNILTIRDCAYTFVSSRDFGFGKEYFWQQCVFHL